ncbi:hypothetical protein A6A06_26855 [Streptomyces sp. CB02923]|uniref:hypothetical protein n=1 Tax=Streptomyces sp. CB02923 TaxID=1718985 RepID=UPI00093CE474|nr:hypothetical protein [Streptomyces sp. CB02923]OKH99188.1 hypothetical protein A6A06_26855 [Streptomyces sp. CB02923]
MRRTNSRFSRAGLAALLALVVSVLGLGGASPAAAADTPALTFTVDKTQATPGSDVTVTMTFTNSGTADVRFVWQSFQPTWETSTASGLKYTWKTCTADPGVTCTPGAGATYSVPIAPNATRKVTMTYTIGADSSCGYPDVAFYSYIYYEFAGGLPAKDGTFTTPATRVICPTTPPAGAQA